jgi:hypothetical protein
VSPKPRETVTKADIKRKLDEVIEEAKRDLKGQSSKIAAGSVASALLLSAISYFVGKRRGKSKAGSK